MGLQSGSCPQLRVYKGHSKVQCSERSVLAADISEPFLFGNSLDDATFDIFVSDELETNFLPCAFT